MKFISYKRFREHQAANYVTKEGRFSRAQMMKKLESYIVEEKGEGIDFFKEYEVRESP